MLWSDPRSGRSLRSGHGNPPWVVFLSGESHDGGVWLSTVQPGSQRAGHTSSTEHACTRALRSIFCSKVWSLILTLTQAMEASIPQEIRALEHFCSTRGGDSKGSWIKAGPPERPRCHD